ncbi:MAG: alanine racemase [Arcobacteraceae bacterium]|nr:alanine racemase [Arcobacteraceae bacterium]
MGYIKLNQKAFFHNLDYFSQSCGSKDKVAIALKDNAYGHGIEQIASMASKYGIKHVFVRDLTEASIAQKFGFESILVLYDIPTKKEDDSLIISINSLSFIKQIPSGSKCEFKIDTGMNRNGIYLAEIEEACKLIKEKKLILNGIFTHFCCSDEENSITKEQEENFQLAIQETKKYIDYNFRVHCANSTGVFKVNMNLYDIARVGIGIYGYLDTKEEQYLQPVLSLHAQKLATKNIKKGNHIGYGSDSFITPSDMVVSNYNIGYGDGLFRANSHKQRKIANGLEILGRVSMDSFSVESKDDEVCVFDNVTHLAQVHNTIKYEILTSLKPSIKRLIVE